MYTLPDIKYIYIYIINQFQYLKKEVLSIMWTLNIFIKHSLYLKAGVIIGLLAYLICYIMIGFKKYRLKKTYCTVKLLNICRGFNQLPTNCIEVDHIAIFISYEKPNLLGGSAPLFHGHLIFQQFLMQSS